MKRASDVPPVVLSSGSAARDRRIAPVRQSLTLPGGTRKTRRSPPSERVRPHRPRRVLGVTHAFELVARPQIVEADVEGGPRHAGDELVAGLPMSIVVTCEPRWLKMRGAVVELGSESARAARDEPMRRIVGEMRIGDMALHALDDEPAGHAAAPADLDHVAEPRPMSARRRRRRRASRRARRASRAPSSCR